MTQIYWIFFVTMTTVSIQATGDIASLEKKMHLLEQQVNMRLKSHDARLEQPESKPSLCNTTMYSFSTRLHEDTDIDDSAIIFGIVNINIGNGYDEFTGVFNAPVPGLYLLSTYARTADRQGNLFIRKNDDVVCATLITNGNANPSDYRGHDTGTCTGIAELVPGDSVRATGNTDYSARIAGSYSGFIGHLIQPYC